MTHLAEVLRLRHAPDIEELGDGLEAGKALRDRLAADRVEAALQVQPGGERVQRDVDASHGERGGGGVVTSAKGGREGNFFLLGRCVCASLCELSDRG